MAEKEDWAPPTSIEELYDATSGNLFSAINAPTSGARSPDPVPCGDAPFQLYSLATPNGQKVGILLEELGIAYDAHVTNIGLGEQFHQGFVDINPNSKIPCAMDHMPKLLPGGADGGGGADGNNEGGASQTTAATAVPVANPVRIFESGSIMLYLAEKEQRFLPSPGTRARVECCNWLMWQMAGQGPMTGNFGHFMV